MHFLASLLLLLTAADADRATTGELPFQVETISGQTQRGALVELSERKLVLRDGDKSVSLPTSDVLRISPQTPPPNICGENPTVIELAGGSVLQAGLYTVQKGTARFALCGGGEARVSTRRIQAVRLKAESPEQAAQWAKIRALDAGADLLVLRKGDKVDYVKGVLGDIDDKTVGFNLDGEPMQVPRAKVEGLIYFTLRDQKLPPAAAQVTDSSGSRFAVERMTLTGGTIKLVTSAGLEISQPLGAVAQIDFGSNKIVYLSDLKPASVKWTPFVSGGSVKESLERLYQPRPNRALLVNESAGDDGLLQLRDADENNTSGVRSYAKGLGLHSRTMLVFDLADPYRRLQAIAGIDARTGGQGHVRLVIHGDDRELFSADIRGSDAPKPLDLDVTGVRKLTILVDFGQQLDFGDYLDLCDARLVK